MRGSDLTRRKFLSAGTAAAGAAVLRPGTLGSKCHDANGDVLVDYFAVGRALAPTDFYKSGVQIKLGIPTQLALEITPAGGRLWWSNFTYKELEEQLERMAKNCLLASGADANAAQLDVKWKSADLSASEFDALHSEFIAAFASYVTEAEPLYAQHVQDWRAMLNVIYLDAWGFEVNYKTPYQEFTASGVQDTKQKANVAMIAWLHHLDAIAATMFKHSFPDVMDEGVGFPVGK